MQTRSASSNGREGELRNSSHIRSADGCGHEFDGDRRAERCGMAFSSMDMVTGPRWEAKSCVAQQVQVLPRGRLCCKSRDN